MKQDINLKIIATILYLAALAIVISPVFFKRSKYYGCTIQFVDSNNGTVLMSLEATCNDDGKETDREPYYTHRVYSFEAYSTEKEQHDTTHNTNLWNAERDAWHQADIYNSLQIR